MKALVPVNWMYGVSQEEVEVEFLFKRHGLFFFLHRPAKVCKYSEQLWYVSELETGYRISSSLMKNYAVKKAEKRIDKNMDYIRKEKEKIFQSYIQELTNCDIML